MAHQGGLKGGGCRKLVHLLLAPKPALRLPALLPHYWLSRYHLNAAGFDEPWERLLYKGRELSAATSLVEQVRRAQ